MKTSVIGQTGRTVLSDEKIQYMVDRKRTVRYQYTKVKRGWIAWVCGPFHSRTYGAIGYGTSRSRAKVALRWNLANSYGYIGHMLFSDVDEADNVGRVYADDDRPSSPISICTAVGSAGV